MGNPLKFKNPVFVAIDSKIYTFNGIKSTLSFTAKDKFVAQMFCRIANHCKGIIRP